MRPCVIAVSVMCPLLTTVVLITALAVSGFVGLVLYRFLVIVIFRHALGLVVTGFILVAIDGPAATLKGQSQAP